MRHLLSCLFFFIGIVYLWSAAPPDCTGPLIAPNRVYWGQFDAGSYSGLPKPPCSNAMPFDRWYRFFATGSTMTVIVTGEGCDPAFVLYGGKCPNSLEIIECVPSIKCGTNKNPALTFTNLEAGKEYFIRIYSEIPLGLLNHFFSVSVTDVNVESFSDVSGNAKVDANNDDCASLTDNANQTGCAFYKRLAGENMVNWGTIDLSFTLNFGSAGAASRDGMAFVLTTGPPTCGNGGYGLGAEGIPNSLIVEFDTWDDGVGLTPDIPEDHITLFRNGDFTTPMAGPFSVPGLPEFADGNDHEFRFYWEPYSMVVRVEFNGQTIFISGAENYVPQCFGGFGFDPLKKLRFGFTSSTGAQPETHTVCFDPHFQLQLPMNEFVDQFLCEGFSYTSPNGMVYSSQGTFYEDFVGANGCNAVRRIKLTKRPLPTKEFNVVICAGETYQGYSNTGSYEYIKNGIDCDTIITLNLEVLNFDIITFFDNDINCKNDKSYIYAFVPNLPSGPGFDPVVTYSWSSLDGNIVSGSDTDSILVNKGGTYRLEVTVSGTNYGIPYSCTVQSDPVFIYQTYDAPTATVIPNGILSCLSEQMLLDGGLSSPFNISFVWSTTTGHIVGTNTDNFVSIDQPGTYLLTVTHDISGCTDTASIKIKKSGFATTAELAKTSDIDCANDTIALTATISDNNFDHLAWTTPDGNILTDTSTNEIFVNKAGEYFLTLFDDNDCESVISIVVTEAVKAPVVSAGVDNILNCDKSSLNVTGSVTTTSTNYTYQWKDGDENILSENQLQLNVSGPGWYVFSAYDSLNHCSAVDSVKINSDVNYPVLASIADQKLTCQQISIALNGNVSNSGSNMVYTWSTTGGNFTGPLDALITTADQTGQYQLIAENSDNGCADTIQLSVTGSIDQPMATAGLDVILDCLNPTSNADGTYTSNDAANNIAIAWSTVGGNIQGPTNGLNINVASPGLYIISVTNNLNGCSDSDTLAVLKNDDKPIVNFNNVVDITCLSSTIDITPLWTNAGINPTITWVTIGGNIITVNPDSVIQVDKAGEYNLTVVNEETGCITTGGVIVVENKTLPDGTIPPPDQLTCTIKTAAVEFEPPVGSNYTYTWSTSGGNIIGATNGVVINVDKDGTYEVEVTDAVNGCKSIFSADVNISNEFPGVNAGANDALNCIIQTITLNGVVQNVTDYNVTWQAISGGNIVSGGSTLTPDIDEAGTYIMNIINNENGCKGADTVVITANITEPEFLGPDIIDADCLGKGGSISFDDITNANEPYIFKVNGKTVSSPDYIFDDLNTGSYTIEVTDANGCKSSFDGDIGKATEVTMTLPDTLVLVYGQVYSDLFPEFQFDTTGMTLGNWAGANYLDCTNCLNPVLKPTSSATLTFSVTSAEGCVAKDEVYIRVRKKEGDYFIPNSFSPGDRNGINDFVTVFTDSYTIPLVEEFRIFNRWGAEVFSRTNFSPNDEHLGWNGYYNGSICNPGVYVYYAKFKTIDGDPILAKGDITIIK